MGEGVTFRLSDAMAIVSCDSDGAQLFAGCETHGGSAGIHLTQSREGRPSGEAFVEFASEDDVQMALKKNKDHLGNRYIEGKIPADFFSSFSLCVCVFSYFVCIIMLWDFATFKNS